MDFDNIKAGIARLLSLVEGWENAGVTELERDIALEELRRIYSEIRFVSAAVVNEKVNEPAPAAVPPVVTEEPVREENASDEDESEEPEIEVELIMSDDEDEPEDEELPQETTAETASEPEEETVPEPEEEQIVDESEMSVDKAVDETIVTTDDTAENHGDNIKSEQSLFGDDEVVLSRSSRRRVLMSLYDDEMPTVISERTAEYRPESVTKSEPAKEAVAETEVAAGNAASVGEPQEPVAIPEIDDEMVLGDVLRADVHTLGDSIARPKGIAESAPVASLREAIGINDRFLLIRDLFGGDAAAYEKAVVAIDSFDNLDDCMVHIVENYSWRSTSDGAKLIMNLIQRKFRK